MSWDVLLETRRREKGRESDPLPPLGDRDEIIDALTAALPALDYSEKTWGILRGEGFSIEFNTGKKQTVDRILLHVRGSGNAIESIRAVCEVLGCQALDTAGGEYIDFDRPAAAEASWKGFQLFRDRVVEHLARRNNE